jgi:tight adherence protein C
VSAAAVLTGLGATVVVLLVTTPWAQPPPRRAVHLHPDPRPRPAASPGPPLQVQRATAAAVGAAVLVTGVLIGTAPVVALVAAALGAPAVVLLRRRAEQRRRRDVADALPETVDVLVALLRAGLTPSASVREAVWSAPRVTRPALAAAVHRLDLGQRTADALAPLADDLGPTAVPFVDALVTAERLGLPLAPVLDRLAHDVAAQRRRRTEALARELPVRLSFPLVLCTLPSFVLLTIVPALAGALSSLPRP